MRVAFDTNVLISAFIAQGKSADLLEHCVHRHEVVLSDYVLAEVREKLLGKFKYAESEADEVVALLRQNSELVTPAPLETPVCRDPDDDMVLATALMGVANCLVTGDKGPLCAVHVVPGTICVAKIVDSAASLWQVQKGKGKSMKAYAGNKQLLGAAVLSDVENALRSILEMPLQVQIVRIEFVHDSHTFDLRPMHRLD